MARIARVDLPKSNLKERRLRRKRIVALLLVFLVLLVFGVIVELTWLPFLRIHTIDVTGQRTVSKDEIVRSAEAEITGGYLHLFSKSNILLYPRSAIRQRLQTQFPTLASVTVQTEGLQTIGIQLVERQPLALWCGVSIASSSGCYLLDQTGVVYAPALVYSGDAYQKYYGPIDGASLPRQFLDASQLRSLAVLIDILQKKQNMRVITVAVDSSGDVHLVFDSGFELIMAMAANGADVVEQLQLAFMASPFMTHPLSDFEYLDLRFGDKLYYKLKSSAIATSTSKKKN